MAIKEVVLSTLRCKHWDCGWCYAPSSVESNARGGSCGSSVNCKEFEKQRKEFLTRSTKNDKNDE